MNHRASSTLGDARYRGIPRATPDIKGTAGRAWKLDPPRSQPDHDAHIASFLIEAPHSHPRWYFYVATVVHLRSIPGEEHPPVLHFAEATHEFMVIALNPEHKLPRLKRWRNARFLLPPDQVLQFQVTDDRHAAEVLEASVRAITNGQSCDQDYRAWWREAIHTSAQHYMEGVHP